MGSSFLLRSLTFHSLQWALLRLLGSQPTGCPEGEGPAKGYVTEQPLGRPSWLPGVDGHGLKERPGEWKLPGGTHLQLLMGRNGAV